MLVLFFIILFNFLGFLLKNTQHYVIVFLHFSPFYNLIQNKKNQAANVNWNIDLFWLEIEFEPHGFKKE